MLGMSWRYALFAKAAAESHGRFPGSGGRRGRCVYASDVVTAKAFLAMSRISLAQCPFGDAGTDEFLVGDFVEELRCLGLGVAQSSHAGAFVHINEVSDGHGCCDVR
jgi:hypothetical protein